MRQVKIRWSMTLAFFASSASAITIPTNLVDNAGNAPDPVVMGDGTTGYGDVPYPYRIGTHEVTNSEYAAFLNAVAASDPNGLFNTGMSAGFNGGINRSGSAGSYTYAPKIGFENKPVNYVTFYDAARFCNWLHNAQPVGPQGPDTTEDGAYTLLGTNVMAPGNGDGIGRNNNWLWAIPSEDEWHKAAYNGPGNTWTTFATQSNSVPGAKAPPGGVNSANYNNAVPLLTTAGAYTQTLSYWGVRQMNGNVSEWNQGNYFTGSLYRRIRGGGFDQEDNSLVSNDRGGTSDGIFESNRHGFRVVQAVEITGACCLKDGECLIDATVPECAAAGGFYQGHGSACGNVQCPTNVGACCFANGTCAEEHTSTSCAAAGGLFQGVGADCKSARCAVVGSVLLVHANAQNGGNGAAWTTAFNDLQDALDVARAFPQVVAEIWVASGIYTPDRGGGNRQSSFELIDGIALYGGFDGTETSLEQRDPSANITILTGDLTGNDVFNHNANNTSFDENSYHVLKGEDLSNTTTLDGFHVRSGLANWAGVETDGGGLWIQNSSLKVNQCVFTWNLANNGGGIASIAGSPSITNCEFQHNWMYNLGGSMYNLGGQPVIDGCEFLNNTGWNNTHGAAIVNDATSAQITNCLFQSNEYEAVRLINGCSDEVVACDFIGNIGKSPPNVGPAIFAGDGTVLIDNCHFEGNSSVSPFNTGAVSMTGPHILSNCTFVGNTSANNAGALTATSSVTGSPTVVNCLFEDNSANVSGGAMIAGGTVAIENCQFINNSALQNGGGIYATGFPAVTVQACLFQFNSAGERGGGLYLFQDGVVTLIGSTFQSNEAPLGSGVFNHRGMIAGSASLLKGDDLLNGMNMQPGAAGTGTATIDIDGDYRHAILGETGDQMPVLFVDIAGTVAGEDFDSLNVSGDVQIDGGSLIIEFGGSFAPKIDETFEIITAKTVSGHFELLGVVGAPTGMSAEVEYLATAVRVKVVESVVPNYTNSPVVPFSGTPTSVITTDFNLDGFVDIVLTIPANIVNQPGAVLAFPNAGIDGSGQWLGWESPPFITNVGTLPRSVAAGLLSNDAYPDLVVANQGDTTASVLRNLGGNGFALVQNYQVGGEVTSIAIGQLAGDALLDFAGMNKTAGKVRIFRNAGNLTFLQANELQAGPASSAIVVTNTDGDTDVDIVTLTPSQYLNPPSYVSVFVNSGSFNLTPPFNVGRAPIALAVTPINLNATPDAVTLNRYMDDLNPVFGISVLLNNSFAANSFVPAIDVPLDREPLSMTTLDLEPDGDQDIVAVVKEFEDIVTYLRFVTNSQTPRGETVLTVSGLTTDNFPQLLAGGDVDNDGDQDLIIINSDAAAFDFGPTGSIEVLLNGPVATPGDVNGDGVVNVVDLLAVIQNWGPCPPSADCMSGGRRTGAPKRRCSEHFGSITGDFQLGLTCLRLTDATACGWPVARTVSSRHTHRLNR